MSRVPRLHVPALPPAGVVALPEEEAAHLVRVLRARPGDVVRLFDGRGREVEAVVGAAGRSGASAEIVRAVDAPRPAREVTLCAAVPRGERMEWLVEKCTEAGAARILPLAARRSVRREAGPNALRRWRRAAVEAAKQCGRADVPEVAEPAPVAEVLRRCEGQPLFEARPEASVCAAQALRGAGPVALFVGPEGGLDAEESAALEAAGALGFSLGPLVLRVETAALLAVHAAATTAATGPGEPA